MADDYEIDATRPEDETIQREAREARARYRDRGAFAGSSEASQIACWIEAVAPLVRIILALLAALGAKSVREALARAKALFAPVDVAQEAETLLAAIRSAYEPEEVRDAVTPFVEDRVRLAREVDGLRAEIESLTRGVTHHMTVAAIHRAEIARLTVARDNLQAEVSMLVGGLNDIFGEGAHPAPREALEQVSGLVRRLRAAAPGEAWERARSAMICAMNGASLAHAALVTAWQRYDQTPRAPAAVEPRGDAGTADPDAPTVSIDAITHDFRPGAQDGMPRLADVEAAEDCDGCRGLGRHRADEGGWRKCLDCNGTGKDLDPRPDLTPAEAREIIASAPVRIESRSPLCVDCSTDPETQHTHTEARPTGRCAACGAGGIMYAPRDEAAELARRAAAAKRAQKEG